MRLGIFELIEENQILLVDSLVLLESHASVQRTDCDACGLFLPRQSWWTSKNFCSHFREVDRIKFLYQLRILVSYLAFLLCAKNRNLLESYQLPYPLSGNPG